MTELSGVMSKRGEYRLGDIFSQVPIRHHPQCAGINQIKIPPDQYGKRFFRAVLGILSQQLLIRLIVHSSISSRAQQKRTEN